MIRDVPKPDVSPDFTIEDIHKIRKWEDERLRDATPEERHNDMTQRIAEAMERLGFKPGHNAPSHTGVAS